MASVAVASLTRIVAALVTTKPLHFPTDSSASFIRRARSASQCIKGRATFSYNIARARVMFLSNSVINYLLLEVSYKAKYILRYKVCGRWF